MYFIKHNQTAFRKPTPNFIVLAGRTSADLVKIAVFLTLLTLPTLVPAIELSSNTEVANAGYYQLSWKLADQEVVLLEESSSESFHIVKEIYKGKDTSTAISGKPNGNYYYRAKSLSSPDWSETVKVTVEHHSLNKAFIFFFFGLIVFASTCFVIIRNHKST